MTFIKQLSREDVMFVAGETDSVYQHVGVLMVVDNSDQPDFNFDRFRQHCIDRIALIPHFHWKLHSVPLGLDRPYWVEDENFNYDHHIKHIALPQPGDEKTLCEVAAHLYSKHLDRNKPLWESWLIEGLEGGKFAYLQKFHHCMMDGQGAFRMMEIICDSESEAPAKKTIDKAISEARPGKVPTLQERSSRTLGHLSKMPGDAARGVYDILRPRVLEQFAWPRKPKEDRPTIPTACFNGVLGSDRAVAFASLPMAELKAVKNHFGASLNDVLLAIVSSAIRNYLLQHGELPEHALRTNIPVSLRSADDAQMSNKVTNTTVTLATNLDDPLARLQAIHEEAEQAKAKAHNGGVGMVELFQMMPPILVSALMDSLPADQAPQILGANVIVSNVRGRTSPLYIAGAKLANMYPMSILTPGMGVNITCVSYFDSMECGIMVDPDLVPNHDAIGSYLEAAAREYSALCETPTTKRKKSPAPAKKKPARKRATPKKPAAKKNPPAKKKPLAKKKPVAKKKRPASAEAASAKTTR
jgi:diacylglycerol O-acyltransferase / wax synthase